jgi:hypothetical protein
MLGRAHRANQMTLWSIENGFPQARSQTIRKLVGVLELEPKELVKKGEG